MLVTTNSSVVFALAVLSVCHKTPRYYSSHASVSTARDPLPICNYDWQLSLLAVWHVWRRSLLCCCFLSSCCGAIVIRWASSS